MTTAEAGHRFPEGRFHVHPLRVEEYIHALGIDPEPDYQVRVGGAVPAGFFMYVTTYGAEPVAEVLQLDPLRTVYGGTWEEFLRPVRVGDTVRVRPEITKITRKQGRSGPLVFVELTTEYLDGNDVAVRERTTLVERS